MNYCPDFNSPVKPKIIFFACVFAFEVLLEILLTLLPGMDDGLGIQGFLILFLFLKNRNLFSVLGLGLFFRRVIVLFSFLLKVIPLLFIVLIDFQWFMWMLARESFLFNVVLLGCLFFIVLILILCFRIISVLICWIVVFGLLALGI